MKSVLTGMLALIAAVGVHGSARAAFSVTLSVQGFASQTIVDGGAGDTNPLANFIGAQGSIDGYNYQITANTNPPNGGFGGQRVVQQNALVTANSVTTSPLVIVTATDGFTTGSASPVTLQVFNALAESNFDRGVATATTTVTPPGIGSGTTPVATVLGGTIPASSDTTTRGVVTSNPFSISNELRITGLTLIAGDTGSPQFNGTLTSTASQFQAAPAPAGIVLALTALPLFGLMRRRWATAAGVAPANAPA